MLMLKDSFHSCYIITPTFCSNKILINNLPNKCIFILCLIRSLEFERRNWINSVPQIAATTLAFSSSFILVLWPRQGAYFLLYCALCSSNMDLIITMKGLMSTSSNSKNRFWAGLDSRDNAVMSYGQTIFASRTVTISELFAGTGSDLLVRTENWH